MFVDSRNDNGSDDLRQISCGVEIADVMAATVLPVLHIPPQIITEPPPYLWCSQMQRRTAHLPFAGVSLGRRQHRDKIGFRLSTELDPILNSN